MSGWRTALGQHLRLTADATDDLVDRARQKLSERLGTNRPRCICAYRGYATRDRALISGRVLANRTAGDLRDNASLWRNLLDTYRRFETDEVPNVPVTVRFENAEQTVRTDDEGFYHAELPWTEVTAGLWLSAEARCPTEAGEITGRHEVLAPGPDTEFGVISDLDDTVIETNVSSILMAAKLTLIGNAKTRKPLEGVSALYRAFQDGRAGRAVNPIFYVSSSPWNLHDLLCDFMELNEIPKGPLFLRDLGLDEGKFIQPSGHRDKLERALRIMTDFGELSFVLVGDSSQHDAAIYAEAAVLHPDRIKAIYIRDVDPRSATKRDEHVREHIKTAVSHGVPMLLAPDSRAMAEHATQLGLIRASERPQVAVEVAKDQARPDPGQKAIEEAL